MKRYVLLNRENVILDIIDNYIRYTKLLSSTGIVVGCEENNGTGVIGSDGNTQYTLMRADTSNDINAVRVLALDEDEVPSYVVPLKYKYDTENNEFVYTHTLEEVQEQKQNENKAAFAAYLAAHPLTWVDGKEYGITQEDQSEISLNLSQYQIAVQAGEDAPVLEWHAKHEECTPWSVQLLTALSLDISKQVYPVYHQMQEYKTRIYNATTIEEVEAIECVFSQE